MAGKKSLLGIDISSTAVRVVRSEGIDKNGNLVVSGVAVVPMTDGAVYGGRIHSTGAVSTALRQAVESLKARNVPAVIGVSDPDAGTAQLRMPAAIPGNKRIGVLRMKSTRVLSSIATHDGEISTYFKGDAVDNDGNDVASVMAAIATREEVEKVRTVAEIAGLNLVRIDLSASATARAVIRDFPTSNTVRALVDIGATTTRVVVLEGLHVQEVRTIQSGGQSLTQAIAAVSDAPMKEAETRKWGMRLGSTSVTSSYGSIDFEVEDQSDEALRSQESDSLSNSANELIEQIGQALSASGGSGSIENLYVVGGTALLRGFLARLKRRTGLDPVPAAPWVSVKKNKHTAPLFIGGHEGSEVNDRIALAFATACGLATPHEGDSK